MVAVIAGERDEDHEYQRDDGKGQDAEGGEGHQKAVDVLLQQGVQVVPEGGDVHPPLLALLGAVGAFQGHIGHSDDDGRQHDGNHAVQHAQHGVIALRIHKDAQGFVPDLLLQRGAQGEKIPHGRNAEGGHIGDVAGLDGQQDEAAADLPVNQVAQTKDEKGQLGNGVALMDHL